MSALGRKNVAKDDETTGQAEHEITKELDEFFDDYVVSAIRDDEELTSADGEYEW
ncbi:hypothetical protein B0A48_09041 [Cryoendolithus antarcticus]|uniref:Uncharacterized protein n=1 Tax=Cryoendolithus antarcticus TaxID=1507870 RepID=A0A1V8T1T9_9PEZI|nr:hypothetical protein B0A48_09041 [Cryoendolithus antarcticus]